jgi:hypothetical protein
MRILTAISFLCLTLVVGLTLWAYNHGSTQGGRSALRGGRDVLVHCRGGLGRAGTIGARLLIELGMEPVAAVEKVRSARPGAIQTRQQEDYALRLTARKP